VILCDRDLGPELAVAAENAGCRIIRLDEILGGRDEVDLQVPEIRDDAVSMIYFTSGSTGEPKGVLLTHRNYIINVENILRLIDIDEGAVFADYHDLGFVISVPTLFPCVLREGALAPGLNPRDAMLPISHLVENEVSVLITVPSTIARIRKGNRNNVRFDKLKTLVSCGEPMHMDILAYAFEQMPAADIFNFYGSTEVAPWTFYHRCRPEDLHAFEAFGYIPIGKPIEGNEVKITDEDELWVSGPQVVPGYLNGENADRFPIDDNGLRWYRTGDKVVVHDGTFICKGRLDSQIKIGGYRIELMDIESHLRVLDDVEGAVCFVEGENLEKIIVAVIVTSVEYALADVRSFLSERLPSYMLPRRVHCVRDVPLNKSGKVDRAGIRAAYALK
jgi:D-alanine--poly(phosphoribitol) ligase subunit 1